CTCLINLRNSQFGRKFTSTKIKVSPSRCPMYIQNSLVAGLSLPPVLFPVPLLENFSLIWLVSSITMLDCFDGATSPNNMMSTSCCSLMVLTASQMSGMHLCLHPANNTLNSLVDSIKFLFSVYTENMIEVFKVPPQ
ncbi:hypothetical protein L9F63_017151, partial [Diploptera punctata]